MSPRAAKRAGRRIGVTDAIDGHRLRRSALAWLDLLIPAAVAAAGWVASLVFNVGHVCAG